VDAYAARALLLLLLLLLLLAASSGKFWALAGLVIGAHY